MDSHFFQETIPDNKIDVVEEYKRFIPREFLNDPFAYFERQGTNVKSGEIIRDETGKIKEDPASVKDLPEWRDAEGRTLHVVGKRINTEKGKVAEAADPFYESRIIDYVRSRDLPAAAVVAKVSEEGSHLMIMEKVPGFRFSDADKLAAAGYSEEDIRKIRDEAEKLMLDLKERFEAAGVKRNWHLKDMIVDIDVPNKIVLKVTPVDWERTKIAAMR